MVDETTQIGDTIDAELINEEQQAAAALAAAQAADA